MKIIPEIQEVYREFPKDYINDINGWGFNREIIENNKGKLLTLDIDFGSYCSLNCPICFRKKNSIDSLKHEILLSNLKEIIMDAKKLGLRSVKFLGAGDPFENAGFLDLLRFLKSINIIPLIFTKGHVIGNDFLVNRYFKDYGITNGSDLVEELFNCNASIMLGFNSFDDVIQAKMVGSKPSFTKIRNNALKILIEHGFNNTNPTKLALAINPVTIENIDEVFEIYKWGRHRNLYCIVTPSMVSGRAKNRGWQKTLPSEEKLIKLYTDIYLYNIKFNIQTIEQIRAEGISPYAGGHVCNQTAVGLYVTLNGIVLSCPGSEENVEGNIWNEPLDLIWSNSMNKNKRSGIFNCKCIAKDGKSIPVGFYDKVLNQVVLKL